MSKRGQTPGRKRSGLSDDDRVLWEHTAKSLKPLKRAKSRVHASLEGEAPVAAPSASTRVFSENELKQKLRKPPPPVDTVKRTAKPAAASKLSAFDVKAARRLRAGRLEIDARIDLHGLRQAEAHDALVRFILRSVARGARWVLVITGKGATTSASAREAGYFSEEKGVLRRNVPRWLAEPDLRQLVVSFKTASIQHGGEGALYVHLRSKDRAI